MTQLFFEPGKDGFFIRIKLTPNASSCGFGELFVYADGAVYLKAGVTVAPEKGKANKELIKMLAKELEISKQSIELVSGATTHYKKFYVALPLTVQLQNKLNDLVKGDKDDCANN